MNPYDEKAKRLREDMLAAGDPDPVLTFKFIKADLGIGHATFYRGPRQELPIIQISVRRFGVRRSDYERWKVSRIIPGRMAAQAGSVLDRDAARPRGGFRALRAARSPD